MSLGVMTNTVTIMMMMNMMVMVMNMMITSLTQFGWRVTRIPKREDKIYLWGDFNSHPLSNVIMTMVMINVMMMMVMMMS